MAKKSEKSKFISKDLNELINESQFMKNSPKVKPQKRQKAEVVEDDDEMPIPKLIAEFQSAKKKKTNVEEGKGTRQKLLEVMEQQLDARKQSGDDLLRNLSDLLTQLEVDYNVLIDNEQKLEQLVTTFLKCVQQSTTAAKQKLKALKEIHSTFKKECEKLDSEQRAETNKLANDLEADMTELQQKLVAETKRKQLDNLRRSIFHAIQNDL